MEQQPEVTKDINDLGVATYLKIDSGGEIEPESFKLIGASTKRDDSNTIGIFGSGLKYSIAYLLRQEIDFQVYSGEKKVEFETRESTFRGTTFNQIVIDGEPTSFTTDLGYDWELWYSIREIYCNAIDEGDYNCEVVHSIDPEEGKTSFYIEVTDELQEILNNWGLYFSESRDDLLYDDGEVKFFKGASYLIVYRKGIRCYYNKNIPSAFHYDLDKAEINESRTIKDLFDVKMLISKNMAACNNVETIRRFINIIHGNCEYFEFDLLFNLFNSYNLGKGKWEEAIGNDSVVEYEMAGNYQNEIETFKPWVLPRTLCEKLINELNVKHIAGDVNVDLKLVDEVPTHEQTVLDKTLEFLKECEYEVEYPVKVAKFPKHNNLGRAKDGIIYISEKALTSVKQAVKVIIEENEHLRTGYDDMSRALQTHLLEMFVDEKSKRFAYPL